MSACASALSGSGDGTTGTVVGGVTGATGVADSTWATSLASTSASVPAQAVRARVKGLERPVAVQGLAGRIGSRSDHLRRNLYTVATRVSTLLVVVGPASAGADLGIPELAASASGGTLA